MKQLGEIAVAEHMKIQVSVVTSLVEMVPVNANSIADAQKRNALHCHHLPVAVDVGNTADVITSSNFVRAYTNNGAFFG